MKRICCLLLVLVFCTLCFAQTTSGYSPFRFNGLEEVLNTPFSFNIFNPVSLNNQYNQSESIFAGSPQWVLDLRRGEIVFFGSLPFTIFFTSTIMGLFRMGQHNWDQRYAPWPFQSAGAIAMDNKEIAWMFGIAGSVSLLIAVADHLIVRNKRRTAESPEY